jgi:hypothetical protein
MPRDEVDVRNTVLSKRVPRVALHLLDPLNSADATNAARLSTTTEQSPDAVDQGQTVNCNPEPALPLKRQVHTNEIEGDRGEQFPGLCFHWLFTYCVFQPQNDEENEDTGSIGTDNATRKGFSLGACFICLTGIQLQLNTID